MDGDQMHEDAVHDSDGELEEGWQTFRNLSHHFEAKYSENSGDVDCRHYLRERGFLKIFICRIHVSNIHLAITEFIIIL